jgi:5-methylcytosine-specific restriction endonuclease McrA
VKWIKIDVRRTANRQQRDLLFSIYDGLCAICGKELPEKFEIDHLIPFSEGGPTQWWNLQPLCLECHSQKSRDAVSGALFRNAKID